MNRVFRAAMIRGGTHEVVGRPHAGPKANIS
jgi:hypothetical protein